MDYPDAIAAVVLTLTSDEETAGQSVMKLGTDELFHGTEPASNGILSRRLGSLDRTHNCTTCGQTFREPGHFGHMDLGQMRLIQTNAVDPMIQLLQCLCSTCLRPLVAKSEIEFNVNSARKMTINHDLKAYQSLISSSKITGRIRFEGIHAICKMHTTCLVCGTVQPRFYKGKDGKIMMASRYTDQKKVRYGEWKWLTPQVIESKLSMVWPSDLIDLGLNPFTCHPIFAIKRCLALPPPSTFPPMHLSAGSALAPDKITTNLLQIYVWGRKLEAYLSGDQQQTSHGKKVRFQKDQAPNAQTESALPPAVIDRNDSGQTVLNVQSRAQTLLDAIISPPPAVMREQNQGALIEKPFKKRLQNIDVFCAPFEYRHVDCLFCAMLICHVNVLPPFFKRRLSSTAGAFDSSADQWQARADAWNHDGQDRGKHFT